MNTEASESANAEKAVVLDVRDLAVEFVQNNKPQRVVDGVSFRVLQGETLGIVGESGSGKTVTNLALLGLLPTPPARIASGSAQFKGADLLSRSPTELRKLRGNEVSMIFQDPMTSLNPFLTIERQLTEGPKLHLKLSHSEAYNNALDMLVRVGISSPEARIKAYPHELSGGMRQRVMIAMALLCDPDLLIADEPTTALDVTIQAQILNILREMVQNQGKSLILISHDLGLVAGMADTLMVMYAGKMMEEGPTHRVFEAPSHPYTLGLLECIPRLNKPKTDRLYSIPGIPPDPTDTHCGCPFAPRCPFKIDQCSESLPEPREVAPGHRIRCHVDVGPLDAAAFHANIPDDPRA